MNEKTLEADAEPRSSVAAALRLSLTAGVGPRIRQALLDRFGTADEVFQAAPSDVQSVPGVGAKIARNISLAQSEIDVEAEIELCRQNGIDLIAQDDEAYPRGLLEIPDPPGLLFVQGALQSVDAIGVAIVGARHATRYGLEQAHRLAAGLARAGVTIVSGLARGIDAEAHRGALSADGRTIAVLGGGLLKLYPPEHGELAGQVAGSGAVISEFPPRMAAMGGTFPQRNRLISGMTLGTIVVEASDRSGALITARHAGEQGREVFAVPGRVDSRMSRGCHRLIRDGAKLVETVDDVLEELGPLVAPVASVSGEQTIRHPAELQLNPTETQVLQAIDAEPTLVDSIAARAQLPIHQVLATITVLESRRLIRRTSGNSAMRI
jgi:DNA processing protein